MAMGVGPFVNKSWYQHDVPTVRVLLQPSFHDDIRITIEPCKTGCAVKIAVKHGRTQTRHTAECPAVSLDEGTLSVEARDRLIVSLRNYDELAAPRWVLLDGILVNACACSGTMSLIHVFGSASVEKLNALFFDFLAQIWRCCRKSRVRNAISDAGIYIGLDLPEDDETLEKPFSRVLVLGTPEDRDELRRTIGR